MGPGRAYQTDGNSVHPLCMGLAAWPDVWMIYIYILSKACLTFFKGAHTIVKTWLSKPVSWGGAGVRRAVQLAGWGSHFRPFLGSTCLYFLKQIQVFSMTYEPDICRCFLRTYSVQLCTQVMGEQLVFILQPLGS